MRESIPVAIVTGASRGLGEVVARILAARGYRLVLNARQPGPLDTAAASIARSSPRQEGVVAVGGDITDAAVRARLVDAARELGGLNVLVNNASVLGGVGPLMDFDVQRFGRVFPVNAGAPIALIQL